LVRPIWRKVVNGASRVISPSEILEQLVLAQRPAARKTLVIPNGLEIGEYAPRANGSRVLVVTRMLERKGVQWVLDSLAQSPVEAEVHIVGDGPFLPDLRRKAEALQSPARFWGWLDNRSPELRELYESAGIFVFPSEAENFPIVLLEAMAAGLAIITTEGTGCAEVVGDAGLLVPVRDSGAIGRALRRLLDNPELRRSLGAAARRRIEDNFTWSAVARRYVEEYGRHSVNGAVPALNLTHGAIPAVSAGSALGLLAAAQTALPWLS
jgi:glycosyltransferase involved in cell wall biosynthesis